MALKGSHIGELVYTLISNGVSGARGGGRPLLDAGSKGSVGFSGGDRDLWAPGWMQHI